MRRKDSGWGAGRPSWLSVLAAGLLGGCVSLVPGEEAVTGQPVDAAVALYGPWAQEALIQGRTVYIWRREVIDEKTKVPYVCELRATVGFRRTIASTVLEGYPQACELFSVSYKAEVK